jgi:glycosyltransferase involved in cell wall biosynthesis
LRIAVVSPFVDRTHGTERAIAELVVRLAQTYQCEVHLFAQCVADLKTLPGHAPPRLPASPGSIYWHRVVQIPGPQLLRFSAWFVLNGIRRPRGAFDLVLSPGINCLDADVVIVHALFARLVEVTQIAAGGAGSFVGRLRDLHRRAYYSLLAMLERRIYANRNVFLAAVSTRTASLMESRFHRRDIRVIANGVDARVLSPSAISERREKSRSVRGLRPGDFVLLLIGNDWATKGIHTIFEAMALLTRNPIRLLVVGGDAPEPYVALAAKSGILDLCIWEIATPDVLDCYAAADVYVSPSKEDSFGLPVLEAMACGLPVITSAAAGVSELVKNGVDGFVLQQPEDAHALAELVARLHEDPPLRRAVGEAGAITAREFTWDRNAAAVWELLSDAASKKAQR